MQILHIYYDSCFERRYRKLPPRIREFAKVGEKLFRENPFDPQLKTHKLHGRDKEVWAFSVSYRHRIKFIFLKEDSVLFLDVGAHNQVY